MQHRVFSADGTAIQYETSGDGKRALLFVHGWLGSNRWWDAARAHFSAHCTVAALDLAGHGQSATRAHPTVRGYADDIEAVAAALPVEEIVLVGHSMSGSNVVEAASGQRRFARVILVDTLHDLDHAPTYEVVEPFFEQMRADFGGVVRTQLPQHLFLPSSPKAVVERIVGEFAGIAGPHAIALLEPYYRTDMRAAARRVRAPIRAINSTIQPTAIEVNRKYFPDYDAEIVPGVGHYPMLENPELFHAALERSLR